MNKRRILSILFVWLPAVCLFGVSANTDVTNLATVNWGPLSRSTNAIVTVGAYYGVSALVTATNSFTSPANYTYRIPVTVTNNGNDADPDARIAVTVISNNAGYAGSNWSCYVEIAGTNAGTNYAIPFTDFGEGAVFSFIVAVQVPLVCPIGSQGFVGVDVSTSSNAGHVAAFYTGFNGVEYGGYSNAFKLLALNVDLPNTIASITASDGVESISVFDGTRSLRRTRQTITVQFSSPAVDPGTATLWFDVDETADGTGGANLTDVSVRMRALSSRIFTGVIDEAAVRSGSFVSFLFELDGVTYFGGYLYGLADLGVQDAYETVLMNNIIEANSGDGIYLKLPARVLGERGRVSVYSVSANLVQTLLDGNADNQVLRWDGRDRTGANAAKGMYFITVDFPTLKEVRKVFIR